MHACMQGDNGQNCGMLERQEWGKMFHSCIDVGALGIYEQQLELVQDTFTI